ncbi:MAG: M23 family metallopeptidase [Anaerolineales bacterium]|nr:M23 family metallopeptidase [Anaerolineales bacterium]
MPDYQIMLIPSADRWAWVEAAKPYIGRFHVHLTSDPDEAARYMTPLQTITLAAGPAGYPAHGDIQTWFRANYPRLRLDVIPAATPADLGAALQARLTANARYLGQVGGFRLRWPTDFARINQGFGENPELYRRWGLPGHEGLDIFAPRDSPVYACADGAVSRVDAYNGDPSAMPYGNSVRIKHAGGYETVYAHLRVTLVRVGQVVTGGAVIGQADSTGNSSGDHLHLTLKQAGATAAGLTAYPRDILDPTPYLDWPGAGGEAPSARSYPWPPAMCLVGLHGRADGPLQDPDYAAINAARIEAVKLLTTAQPANVDRLRADNPRVFILMRLFASFDGRVVRSDEFANWMQSEMAPFYDRGLRYFEIHNEPNLRPEGWTQSWADGAAFGAWFLDVRHRLKQVYPEALFGYPGLSPGDAIPGLRANALDFLAASDAAARAADWVGLHCYWVSEQELNSASGGLGYVEYRRRFPDKLIFITEFSNATQHTDKDTKAKQYTRYYQHLRSIPGLGAAFAFVVSSSSGFDSETWRLENGQPTAIPGLVAARQDVVSPPPPPPPG